MIICDICGTSFEDTNWYDVYKINNVGQLKAVIYKVPLNINDNMYDLDGMIEYIALVEKCDEDDIKLLSMSDFEISVIELTSLGCEEWQMGPHCIYCNSI